MTEQLTLLEEAAPKAVETTNETVPSKEAVAESEETKPLSTEERNLLQETEKVIETGLGQFLAVGQALSEINRSQLYRESFPTFEEYCNVRWNLGSNYAYRLIASADCAAGLKEAAKAKGYKVLPSNESQVRPLTKLKPKRQVTAWNRAVKAAKGKNVTAEVVEKIVNGMLDQNSTKESTKSTKQDVEHQLESIGKLVHKKLAKASDLDSGIKKLLKQILELTGWEEKSSK